jgi:heat-inducible transcriptional repressor
VFILQRLDERKEKILAAVVRDYLQTAEPVGSRTIWRSYIHDLSPATIRNEMSDLEELGLITQPHTSAGRIPTDNGYRYYVDYLMRAKALSPKEKAFLKQEYSKLHHEVDELLHKSLKVISNLCDYTAIAYVPSLYQRVVKMVQMVLLNLNQIMIVLLTDTGPSNIILDISKMKEKGLEQEDLYKISNLLTHELSEAKVSHIDKKMAKKIIGELPSYGGVLEKALSLINDHLAAQNDDRILSAGLSKMLKQPEFVDVEQMRHILELVEHDKTLSNVLKDASTQKGITIKIGKENKIKDMEEVSLVFSSIVQDDFPKAGFGIIGPKRMSYGKMVGLMNSIQSEIEDFFGDAF